MPAITTLDTFLDLLRRSGAIDSRRLDGFLANKYGGNTPSDPNRIANDLIDAGLLTKYHTEPLLAGRPQRYTLSGKYRMIDRLGSGGMASVFLCEHRVMRRRVAVKMLPPSVASNASALDRFHREARAMAGVHHPNIVGAHDVDQDGKIHFIVMEYVDGTNFHELVRRVGPLPVDRAAHYTAQAAKGLQHAHDKGLVHRDIKPANLLLDRLGLVKILDLGLALVFQSNDDNLTRDHDANSILGTAEYLAPEQAVDSHNVDHRADIYSLGMTMYFILTAQTPFGEGTTAQKLIWHQLRQPKPVRDHRPDVPEELWTVLAKMLAKDPKDRYQSMQDVADALAPWTGTPIPPPADREMPKPLADLSADGPLADYSSSSSNFPSAASLPSPLEPTPTSKNGKSPSAVAPPPVQEVNFAMPGGLEATTNTLPVSAAPTDPKKPAGPGSSGSNDKPIVAVVAPPAAPASSSPKPKPSVTPPAVAPVPPSSAPKSAPKSPAPSSPGAKRSPTVSGVVPKVVAPAVVDDDEDEGPRGKPKSKKIKRKPEKKSNTVLYAAVGGGLAALVAVVGLVMLLSGKSSKPLTGDQAGVSPPTQVEPTPLVPNQAKEPGGEVKPTAPVEPLPFHDAELQNVAVNGHASASESSKKATEIPQAAFDDDRQTKWVGNKAPWWIFYEFAPGVDHAVRQYGIVSADYKDGSRDPKDWQFQGSSDGTDWKTLDERKDQTFPERKKLYVYNVARPAPFRFYRLNVLANNGAKNIVHITELGLYAPRGGVVPQPNVPGADPFAPTGPETLPLPRASAPMPSAPAEPTVTADFFPLTPRDVIYQMAANQLPIQLFGRPPTGQPWGIGNQRWTFREAKAADAKAKPVTEIAITLTKFGWSKDPEVQPLRSRDAQQSLGVVSARVDDGAVQLGTFDPVTRQTIWQPILKIGAKLDSTWEGTLPSGDRQRYTVTEFGSRDDRQSVTVKTDSPLPGGGVAHNTYVFVKGVGQVEHTVLREGGKAKPAKAKTEPDYELKIRE